MKIFIIKMTIGMFFLFVMFSIITISIWIASDGTLPPNPAISNWIDWISGFMTGLIAYAVGNAFYETLNS